MVGSWGRGGIMRVCTQFVVGREGISVNNSDLLHNTGPQESVMYLMYKNRLPLCFCTQPSWVGTQENQGFVLMRRDHTRLLLNLPALGTHLLPLPPLQALGPFPTQHPEPPTTNLQGFLTSKVTVYLSLSNPKIHEDLFL